MLCRRVEKSSILVVFSDNFHTAYTLNGLQLDLFRLLTQRQRPSLPPVHNEKLKGCFAPRRCQFFPHPIRQAQALVKQITINKQPERVIASYKILFLMLGTPRYGIRWTYSQGTVWCANPIHGEVHQL